MNFFANKPDLLILNKNGNSQNVYTSMYMLIPRLML